MDERKAKKRMEKLRRDVALSLIAADPGGERSRVATRYLSLCARRKTLRRALKSAAVAARDESPLARIGFQAPLCVAGHPSSVIVRAEGLQLAGIPIAFEKTPEGQSRGTSLDDVLALMPGASPIEILDHYRDLMSATPSAAHRHPERRIAIIPHLLERLRIQIDSQSVELEDAIAGGRFRALVSATDLSALGFAFQERTTITIVARNKFLIVDKAGITCIALHRGGAARVAVADIIKTAKAAFELAREVNKTPAVVSLDFGIEDWSAYPVAGDTPGKPLTFRYA